MDYSPYLDLFVAEAREHLSAAYALASRPADEADAAAALRDVFRHVHSVKGMAASMGFGQMSGLAHDAESLMDRLRAGRLQPQASTRQILCDTLACLERMVERAERRDDVDDEARAALQGGLRRLLDEAAGSDALGLDTGGSARPVGAVDPRRASEPAGHVTVAAIVRRDRTFPAIRAAVVVGRLAKLGRPVRTDPPMAALRTGRFDGRLLVTLDSALPFRTLATKIAGIDEIETFTLAPAQAPPPPAAPATQPPSLRVRADRVDALLEDVLELMSTLGRIDAREGRLAGAPGSRDHEAARRLARRTYDAIVELRLVPFETVTQRLRRTADDLSRRLGKPLVFDVEGEDVRVDRSLLERLMDPLLHMVRNAIDHGLETADGRRSARKRADGRVAVRLERQAARLILRVEDDGRGLDPRRLKEVAIERGLLTPSEAVRLPDHEALQLITLPAFTTVEQTTEVSGRGVGMDIVKSTVDALGGRVHISADPGRWTRIELTLPSSVALVQAYLVRTAAFTFAVPLASISRMAPMDDSSTTWRDGRRYWSVGATDVPITTLREAFELGGEPPARGGMALIVDEPHGTGTGVEVEEVLGRCEAIVRPLPPPLAGLPGYTGAAVLDDGSIVLVIDPALVPRGGAKTP